MLDSIGSDIPDSLEAIAFETNAADREKKLYLLNQVVQYFAKDAITISLDSASFSLVFEKFDVVIRYKESKTGMLGFNRELKRTIMFKSNGFLVDNSRMKVVNPFQFDTNHRDIIYYDDFDRIENTPYTFCEGNITEAVTWTKYIEPAIVIVSVAGIVYLLFSMRF